MRTALWLAILSLLAVRIAAQTEPSARYQWDLPPRVAAPRLLVGAAMTAARVALGRHLF